MITRFNFRRREEVVHIKSSERAVNNERDSQRSDIIRGYEGEYYEHTASGLIAEGIPRNVFKVKGYARLTMPICI